MLSGQFGLEFWGENLDVLGDWGYFCVLRFGGQFLHFLPFSCTKFPKSSIIFK
jgi:hypothetical protein